MVRKFIPYGQHCLDEDDIQAVIKVLQGEYLTTGPWVSNFEQAVAKRVGAQYGIAVSSGTAALHAACHVAGFGPGDEVIVPANTFAATANAVLYVGAKPVFADIQPGTWNIDPEDIARKITKRTKGIIPVHFAGQPVDLEEIWQLAREHNLVVIEDACHALGASYKGKPIGGLSHMTVFSFHPVKHIATGEGGMITTNDYSLAQKLYRFRTHGIEKTAGSWFYQQLELGYNYRLTDIQAGLGLSQLKKLDLFIQRRTELALRYNLLLKEKPIGLPLVKPERVNAWHLYVIQINNREKVYKYMLSKGIGVNVHYIPVYWHPYYQKLGYQQGLCPVAEDYYQKALTIPLYFSLTDKEQELVIQTLFEVI